MNCRVDSYWQLYRPISSWIDILRSFNLCLSCPRRPRLLNLFSEMTSSEMTSSEMTSSEIEKLWYKALFEEDCLKVKELLKRNPKLLKVGWKHDHSRMVEGSPDNHWEPVERSSWMGRTALHVGARRGDIELVQEVLILCGILDAALLASGTAANAKDGWGHLVARHDWSSGIHFHYSCDICEMHPISGLRFRSRKIHNYDLCSECFRASGAEEIEYTTFYPLAGRMPRKVDQNTNLTPDSTQKNSSIAAAMENSSETSNPQVLRTSSRVDTQGQLAEGKSDCALEGDKQAVGESGESFWEGLASITDLGKLLVSKDGRYKLDAFAMAILHGNVGIAVLLLYALGEYENNPYLIFKMPSFTIRASLGIDSRQRIELTKVTSKVIDYFRNYDPQFMAECEKEYYRHRDFNFLPLEEYLFHFSWTARFEDVFHVSETYELRRTLWRTVRRWPQEQEVSDDGDSIYGEELREILMRTVRRWRPQKQAVSDEGKSDGQELSKEQTKPDGQEQKADEEKKPTKLWQFLLTLHDGQGRAPMHVAVDEGIHRSFTEVLGQVPDSMSKLIWQSTESTIGPSIGLSLFKTSGGSDAVVCAASARDGSGKIAVHRAAAMAGKADRDFWSQLYSYLEGESTAHCTNSEHPMNKDLEEINLADLDFDILSAENGFRSDFDGSTPLQAAIIHKNFDMGKILFQYSREEAWNMFYFSYFTTQNKHAIDIMELVCFVGADPTWVRFLLEEKYVEQSKKHKPLIVPAKVGGQGYHMKYSWPVSHLVAAYGNCEALTLLINDNCEHFGEDKDGNSALHCAMRDGVSFDDENIQFQSHLLDYVSCKQLLMKDQREVKKIVDDNFFADRQGGIHVLLQAGCDVFRINKAKRVPYPQGMFTFDAKFLSWWYEKQNKEFVALQSSLNNAANAISVTATLVATASFVGPLQPPRSYTEDHQMEYENTWVATFLFCDTLSFYFAIVAIVLSLIPSLPVPQQSMFDELRRTRIMVTMAVAVLLPSIAGVLIAFTASSMAVVSPILISGQGRNLAVSSVSIGGVLILGAFFIFFIRLLGICFPGNSSIRNLYKLTSF